MCMEQYDVFSTELYPVAEVRTTVTDGLYVPEIGELVSVLGQVEEYREEKQLRVTAIGAHPI